jgi:hypothetical protein
MPQASTTHATSAAGRLFAYAGGLLFVASLVYFAVSYVWRFGTMAADPDRVWQATAIDTALFTAFAMHHSIFARTGLRRLVQRALPPALERSFYVWTASLLFLVTCAWWQPVAGTLWIAGGPARVALWGLQAIAAVATLKAAGRLDPLELAGVRQALAPAPAAAALGPAHLDTSGPYRLVRHPIYTAWFLLVWATPSMNGTRLVFAAVSCAYLLAAVPFEERDLVRVFGEQYHAYRRQVRWRVLPFVY